jgi:hypothetical protein
MKDTRDCVAANDRSRAAVAGQTRVRPALTPRYALWYRVLPRLTVTQAAVAQLTVPTKARPHSARESSEWIALSRSAARNGFWSRRSGMGPEVRWLV